MKRRCIASRYQSRRPEKDMTLEHIAMIIAAHIIVLISYGHRFSISSAHRACVFFNPDVSKKTSNEVTFSVELPNALPV
jgi:hypothetical protein